jgi:hypothetical protein
MVFSLSLTLSSVGVAFYTVTVVLGIVMIKTAKAYGRQMDRRNTGGDDYPTSEQEIAFFKEAIQRSFLKPLRWVILFTVLGSLFELAGIVIRGLE